MSPRGNLPELEAQSSRYIIDDDAQSVDFLHEDHVDEDDETSGTCGRAVIREFKRTVGTWWLKEMTNVNQKTFAVSFFIFFAAVAPAITFGAVYGKTTNDHIGAVEMLVATACFGILYSLIGGQPIMINGGTGPVLAISTVLFDIANNFEVNFLTFNAWVGLWVSGYLLLAAFIDLNKVMKHATRFTDEIFALLISFIFIIDALGSPFSEVGIYWYYTKGHDSHEEHLSDEEYSYRASALLSTILCLGTCWLAFFLRGLRFSAFFPNDQWRQTIADFAVTSAILIFTLIGNELFGEIEVERLNVPDSVSPTQICCEADCIKSYPQDCPDIEPYGRRSWFVDLGNLNGKGWIPMFAAVPAMLAFILVFLDNGITWHLINHPQHRITHGAAFNYDTVCIAGMIAVQSMLGLPWLVAATVHSLIHLNALAEKNARGKILKVHETRLTHFGTHLIMLASLFALDVLKLIPMPVLYGIFLFMGLSSLGSNQFFQRVMMFFMQPAKYPKEPFTEHMEPSRMHLWTAIQIGMFVLLFTFRSIKTVAIAFPIIIKACIPIRMYILPRFFSTAELIMIDTDDRTADRYLFYKELKNEREANKAELGDDIERSAHTKPAEEDED